MFSHVVLLNFTQPLSPEDHADIQRSCTAITSELPGIVHLRFVSNESDRGRSYTHAFVADFVNRAAHDHYQAAPVHIHLKQKIATLGGELIVLDYTT